MWILVRFGGVAEGESLHPQEKAMRDLKQGYRAVVCMTVNRARLDAANTLI
jgi:hypothetical protein